MGRDITSLRAGTVPVVAAAILVQRCFVVAVVSMVVGLVATPAGIVIAMRAAGVAIAIGTTMEAYMEITEYAVVVSAVVVVVAITGVVGRMITVEWVVDA